MPNSLIVFEKIKKSLSDSPVLVFDLDSTIYNVSLRTQHIMNSFAREPEIQEKYPQEASQLLLLKVEPFDWGMKETLVRAQFKAPDDFFRKIRDYWKKHFFSSEHLHHDQPYEGAVEYVKALHKLELDIFYLTGRDEKNMKVGTIESLKKHNLPVVDLHTKLIMKPYKGGSEDEEFKTSKMQEIKELTGARPIWFFENEPLIVHQVMTDHPDVNIVWLDTTHSRRAEPPKNVHVIQTFKMPGYLSTPSQ